MKQRAISFDRTEIVVAFLDGNQYKLLNLEYSDIQRIQFDSIMERKFIFKKIPSEKITITTGKREKPIVYTKKNSGMYWDDYKTGLAKFAKNNHITFSDETD